jgi:fermentation-respiration switch protein FrsA (DUF1100 family)
LGNLSEDSSEQFSFYQKVKIRTKDGLDLHSFFSTKLQNKDKCVLIFPGNAGHASQRFEKFNFLKKAGYRLFFLEYRGYGNNVGKPSERGFYQDAHAAVNFLYEQGFTDSDIVLYGESLGAAVAIESSLNHDFHAIVLEAPFMSVFKVARDKYKFFVPFEFLVKDKFKSYAKINNIVSPILIMHGTEDEVVDFSHGESLFSLAPEPKQKIFVRGGSHNNLYDFDIEKEITTFLENN